MIITRVLPDGDVLITFITDDDRPVSVVGNFNGWDPLRHPLREEWDTRFHTTVTVPADTRVEFRYLAHGGEFYDDPDADCFEPNGYGGMHGVLERSLATPVEVIRGPMARGCRNVAA